MLRKAGFKELQSRYTHVLDVHPDARPTGYCQVRVYVADAVDMQLRVLRRRVDRLVIANKNLHEELLKYKHGNIPHDR